MAGGGLTEKSYHQNREGRKAEIEMSQTKNQKILKFILYLIRRRDWQALEELLSIMHLFFKKVKLRQKYVRLYHTEKVACQSYPPRSCHLTTKRLTNSHFLQNCSEKFLNIAKTCHWLFQFSRLSGGITNCQFRIAISIGAKKLAITSESKPRRITWH